MLHRAQPGWNATPLATRAAVLRRADDGGAFRGHRRREGGSGSGMARIEIADLKERIRKLEAIAAGVDL